jgi:hypothetical protein
MKDFFVTEVALRLVNLAYDMISIVRRVNSEKPQNKRLHKLILNYFVVKLG